MNVLSRFGKAGLDVSANGATRNRTREAAQTRNAEFADTLREHAGLLARIAASYEAEPSLRDDLLQEISLALWKALPSRRGESSLKTFVARVAHNRAASHVLKHSRHRAACEVADELVDPAQDPQRHAQLTEKRARLERAVGTLPLTLRQAVTLALDDFSHKEIAQALGISVNNVDVRLTRARQALKVALGESE